MTALGSILKGVGLLVATIGVGTFVAGYLFPDDSAGITKAVENFEKLSKKKQDRKTEPFQNEVARSHDSDRP